MKVIFWLTTKRTSSLYRCSLLKHYSLFQYESIIKSKRDLKQYFFLLVMTTQNITLFFCSIIPPCIMIFAKF